MVDGVVGRTNVGDDEVIAWDVDVGLSCVSPGEDDDVWVLDIDGQRFVLSGLTAAVMNARSER